ncbi:MAG: F0F1 ATP synthase subunit epsilon [candidate division KSB1 bacterium]|nr:F0F1 ATP synthase subunit epsilon [candidate division KSB1 bacterium]
MEKGTLKYFAYEIVTPFGVVYSGSARYLRAPGVDGYFGILPRHAPLLAALKIGEIKIVKEGETKYFAISGGYLEVLANKVSILAETAEEAKDIDIKRAQAALERARQRLALKDKGIDQERARAALLRALNRLMVSKKIS